MSDNVPVLAEAITALRADPRSADIPIIVGGAAFRSDPGLAEEMGADGYAPDATTAVELAERLAVRAQGG
jgi:methanogenic corrinoid protein MtbC1